MVLCYWFGAELSSRQTNELSEKLGRFSNSLARSIQRSALLGFTISRDCEANQLSCGDNEDSPTKYAVRSNLASVLTA
jgi:hypothetical protein